MDDTAFVALAALASAFITLLSNWLTPRSKAVQIKAEGDTSVRLKEAEIESEAFKTINDLLKKVSLQNGDLQQALLANNKTLMEFLEKQKTVFEKLINLLERMNSHDPL